MKKTFTLLATAALLTTAALAQPGHSRDNNYENDNDREVAGNHHRDRNEYGKDRGTYYFSAREKDMQISSINREYYRKMESVRNKFFMSRSKKERILYSLEMQRNEDIRSVVAKFNDRRNSFGRRDNRYNEYGKKNKW